jgi:hypothetical protein
MGEQRRSLDLAVVRDRVRVRIGRDCTRSLAHCAPISAQESPCPFFAIVLSIKIRARGSSDQTAREAQSEQSACDGARQTADGNEDQIGHVREAEQDDAENAPDGRTENQADHGPERGERRWKKLRHDQILRGLVGMKGLRL